MCWLVHFQHHPSKDSWTLSLESLPCPTLVKSWPAISRLKGDNLPILTIPKSANPFSEHHPAARKWYEVDTTDNTIAKSNSCGQTNQYFRNEGMSENRVLQNLMVDLRLYLICPNLAMGEFIGDILRTGISMVSFLGSWLAYRREANSKCHGWCRTPNHCLSLKHCKLINKWYCVQMHSFYHCDILWPSTCVCVCEWVSVQCIVVIPLCVLASLYAMFFSNMSPEKKKKKT